MSDLRPGRATRHLLVDAAFILDLVFGAWAGSEWIARRLSYPALLGKVMYLVPAAMVKWWAVATVVLAAVAGGMLFVPVARRASGIVGVAAVICGWVTRGRPVFAPWSILYWHWRFRHEPHLVAIVVHGWVLAAIAMLLGALALLPACSIGRARRAAPTSEGSAAWDSGAGLLNERGLLIGWRDGVTRGPV